LKHFVVGCIEVKDGLCCLSVLENPKLAEVFSVYLMRGEKLENNLDVAPQECWAVVDFAGISPLHAGAIVWIASTLLYSIPELNAAV